MRRTLMTITLFIAAVVYLGGSSSVYAQNGGIEVSQTQVFFRADRDGGLKVPIRIGNSSDEEMVVSVKKADFEIDDNGVFQVKEPGSLANSASDYIVCDESEFRMPGKSSRVLEISLAPDKTYALPEYTSAILVKYAPVSMVESGAEVKTYVQDAIVVTVDSGSLVKTDFDTSTPPISVGGSSFGGVMTSSGEKNLAFNFKNAGVITIVPDLKATVSGLIFHDTADIPYKIAGIQPGRTRVYSFKFNSVRQFEIYSVELGYDYTYGGKSFSGSKREVFAVISLPLLIGALLVIAGACIQITINKKRKRLLKQLLAEKKDGNNDRGH